MKRTKYPLWLATVATLCLIADPGIAAGQEIVFLARHAERADASSDSRLSAAGNARARRLAQFLKDAGITQIYTSEKRRTIETGAPLANALHLSATELPATDSAALLARIRAAGPHDRLLVVGHSDTVPQMLRGLGVDMPVTIGDMEYDNLFVVIPLANGPPRFVRLHVN